MSSGVNRTKQGAVEGTGAAIDVTTVGFTPAVVECFNVDGDVILKWTRTMPDASGMKTIADGTTAFIESDGITPIDYRGFTIGADSDVNASGEVIHWVAYEGHDYPPRS